MSLLVCKSFSQLSLFEFAKFFGGWSTTFLFLRLILLSFRILLGDFNLFSARIFGCWWFLWHSNIERLCINTQSNIILFYSLRFLRFFFRIFFHDCLFCFSFLDVFLDLFILPFDFLDNLFCKSFSLILVIFLGYWNKILLQVNQRWYTWILWIENNLLWIDISCWFWSFVLFELLTCLSIINFNLTRKWLFLLVSFVKFIVNTRIVYILIVFNFGYYVIQVNSYVRWNLICT